MERIIPCIMKKHVPKHKRTYACNIVQLKYIKLLLSLIPPQFTFYLLLAAESLNHRRARGYAIFADVIVHVLVKIGCWGLFLPGTWYIPGAAWHTWFLWTVSQPLSDCQLRSYLGSFISISVPLISYRCTMVYLAAAIPPWFCWW